MRLAQVSGVSGAGSVVAIHSAKSIQDLEEFFAARGIQDRAIAAPSSWVLPDIAFDGSTFVAPAQAAQPVPTPPTVEQLASELDGLREGATTAYVSTWGDLSKREMWPKLKPEIKELALITSAAGVVVGAYPSIVGFLQGSGITSPSADEIYTTAAGLRAHQSAHIALLRRTEMLRAALITEYSALADDAAKLAWLSGSSLEQRWEAAYGA